MINKTKKLKWFKSEEEIPFSAVYIKSETRRENFRFIDCDCPAQLGCNCHEVDYVEYHLYEVVND